MRLFGVLLLRMMAPFTTPLKFGSQRKQTLPCTKKNSDYQYLHPDSRVFTDPTALDYLRESFQMVSKRNISTPAQECGLLKESSKQMTLHGF